ncbi:MAG TPA: hypothetical protein VF219_02645 [Vicinamibacterales bacterium]
MRSNRGFETAAAAAFFAVLTVAFTWPVTARVGTVVPSDFGDSLLNTWILAWDATHFGRGWWNANIFHPNPLTLGYSEHLAAQALSIAPIYWLTGNAILCYNVVFLGTFVLSGLGVFLLARAFGTGTPAAFIAGLAYAFTPYRISSLPHIQVLSSAWMPFVLLGFRRYFECRRARDLALAVTAWVLQNLSCGYYLLFFAPVVAIFMVWEVTVRGLWRDRRVLSSILLAAATVGILTLPFLLPYFELRQLGFLPRSLAETKKYSADVYGYLTIDPNLRFWGSVMRAWPKAEGALFPGFVVTFLAAIGSLAGIREAKESAPAPPLRALLAAAVAAEAVVIALLLGFTIRLPFLRITSLARTLVVVSIGAAVVLSISRDARDHLRAWASSVPGVVALMTVFAVVMSFGPEIRAMDRRVLDTNLYAFFYAYVPGFDGLRVPARFGMIVMLGLSVLAAIGLQRLVDRLSRIDILDVAIRPSWLIAICGALIAGESFAAPIPVDGNSTSYTRPGLAPLPVLQLDAPPVYNYLASLPADSVIVEFPLGEPAFDVRYMYYSTRHWHRLVNGYSGGMPPSYEQLDMALQDFRTRPERAWEVLRDSRPSHAIVHEAYYDGRLGAEVSEWLRSRGAREIGIYGGDRLFRLPH